VTYLDELRVELAEGSLVEGLIRDAFEALAIVACFLALGRRLGLRVHAGSRPELG
jgi:hypothetical protein